MRITVLVTIVLLAFNHVAAQEVLTNAKIIDLHKAGFSKEILKSKIQTSTCNFDVSVDGMMKLKKAVYPTRLLI